MGEVMGIDNESERKTERGKEDGEKASVWQCNGELKIWEKIEVKNGMLRIGDFRFRKVELGLRR